MPSEARCSASGRRVGVRRLRAVVWAAAGSDTQREVVDLQPVADLGRQGADQLAGHGDVVAADGQLVARLEAALSALVIVSGPDLSPLDAIRCGLVKPWAVATAFRARSRPRPRHPLTRGPVVQGDPDLGGVGDGAGLAAAGNGDGALHTADSSGLHRDPECVEDLQRRLRPVERVEVQTGGAAIEQFLAGLGRHRDAFGTECGRLGFGSTRATTSAGISRPESSAIRGPGAGSGSA